MSDISRGKCAILNDMGTRSPDLVKRWAVDMTRQLHAEGKLELMHNHK